MIGKILEAAACQIILTLILAQYKAAWISIDYIALSRFCRFDNVDCIS